MYASVVHTWKQSASSTCFPHSTPCRYKHWCLRMCKAKLALLEGYVGIFFLQFLRTSLFPLLRRLLLKPKYTIDIIEIAFAFVCNCDPFSHFVRTSHFLTLEIEWLYYWVHSDATHRKYVRALRPLTDMIPNMPSIAQNSAWTILVFFSDVFDRSVFISSLWFDSYIQ